MSQRFSFGDDPADQPPRPDTPPETGPEVLHLGVSVTGNNAAQEFLEQFMASFEEHLGAEPLSPACVTVYPDLLHQCEQEEDELKSDMAKLVAHMDLHDGQLGVISTDSGRHGRIQAFLIMIADDQCLAGTYVDFADTEYQQIVDDALVAHAAKLDDGGEEEVISGPQHDITNVGEVNLADPDAAEKLRQFQRSAEELARQYPDAEVMRLGVSVSPELLRLLHPLSQEQAAREIALIIAERNMPASMAIMAMERPGYGTQEFYVLVNAVAGVLSLAGTRQDFVTAGYEAMVDAVEASRHAEDPDGAHAD